jgi:hypothetical protein
MTLHRTVRSPVFLLSLALLIANDFYFKAQFGNWYTGKLSDFAGLLAFALFWSAVFPRHSRLIHIAIGVAFALWKLPLTDPILTLWNSSSPLDFARVTDLTDLMALVVLPLSYYHFRQLELRGDRVAISGQGGLLKTIAVCSISLFAFTATSYDTSVRYDDDALDIIKYHFDESRDQVIEAASALLQISERADESYSVRYEGGVCGTSTFARITFSTSTAPEQTELQLLVVEPGYCNDLAEGCETEFYKNQSWLDRRLSFPGPIGPSKACINQEFEELVVQPLQAYFSPPSISDVMDSDPQQVLPELEFPPELILLPAMMPQLAPFIFSWSRDEAIRDGITQIWYKLRNP